MRAWMVREPFGIEALSLATRPVPRPGPTEVLVRMRAVSLNYRDLLVVRGAWRPTSPRVPASDGVGEVVEVGEGVTRFRSGDRVAGIFLPGWIDGELEPAKLEKPSLGGTGADGTLAEYVAFEEAAAVPVPEHLSDEEAATLPLAAVTAWHAVTRSGVARGDTVLVQGTGGVSLFALQFARMRGAEVIVTSSSTEKLVRARDLGAAGGVNYRQSPEWGAQVRSLTGGRGVDHVVEVIGGENLDQSLAALRLGGSIAMVGQLGGTTARVHTFGFVEKGVRLFGVLVGSRAMFEEMNAALLAHRLRPVVDTVFDFEAVPEALRYLETGAQFGKICIRL